MLSRREEVAVQILNGLLSSRGCSVKEFDENRIHIYCDKAIVFGDTLLKKLDKKDSNEKG